MRSAETKYKDISAERETLFHNVGQHSPAGEYVPPTQIRSIDTFFNPWSLIAPGVARDQRIGDKITPRGIAIKLFLANVWDRPNTMHRIIVAVLPKEYSGQVVGAQFNPFQTGPVGNSMILPPDKDIGVKFLYDRIIRMNSGQVVGGAAEGCGDHRQFTKYVKLWIKPKGTSRITYRQNLDEITSSPLALYVIPYEQPGLPLHGYGTLQTDMIATVGFHARLYYKDI